MIYRRILILICFIVSSASVIGQETDYGPGYQTIMMNNPAFTGSNGAGIMRLSYLNFYPGNNYNFHSVYFSYDSYFPSIHGGAGFYLADDYLGGIINDIRGGLSYSYFLQADKNFFINAGLSASIYHRGFDFGKAILPDQIDPLGGISGTSGEMLANTGRTVFDIGTGFLFISGRMFGGFSITHLAEPDLSGTGSANERLKRKFLLHLTGDFDLNKRYHMKVWPLTLVVLQDNFLSAGAGAVLESKYISGNAILLVNNNKNMDIQTGFSLKTGKVAVYYNYRFNIKSGNTLMPFSLLHQTGLAFSLNNVEKRIRVKTIKLPEM